VLKIELKKEEGKVVSFLIKEKTMCLEHANANRFGPVILSVFSNLKELFEPMQVPEEFAFIAGEQETFLISLTDAQVAIVCLLIIEKAEYMKITRTEKCGPVTVPMLKKLYELLKPEQIASVFATGVDF